MKTNKYNIILLKSSDKGNNENILNYIWHFNKKDITFTKNWLDQYNNSNDIYCSRIIINNLHGISFTIKFKKQ
jgi:hypothetical protein